MMLIDLALNKFFSIGIFENWIVQAFVSQGGKFPVRHTAAADRSGAVGRQQDDVISQRQQFIENTVI